MSIVAAGVGCGLTAAGAVAGGVDLLACYSTAIYRAAGLPSALAFLPYDDPNELVRSALPEILAVAGDVPVIAGVGAHDRRERLPQLVDELKSSGVAGVTNEPFVGIYSGELREHLELAGLGYSMELKLAKLAVEREMLCLGWAWNEEEARKMAATGASHVGLMLGITSPSRDVEEIQQAHTLLARMNDVVREENPDALTLIHGGLLSDPDSVRDALEASGADGFLGGSALETTPVIQGISAAVQSYKENKVKKEGS
ncbi:phosphoenolpyruvate hydrolase family protein [Flaviflexus massiliensis]|uniref:phosphoenolpyruvate hydrolase family protein n=1 Tax=Flaviflexus massiliensis TaxID=1522309 RepID=UPI0006D57B49|nr:phosphoenolpyruvate hydrolase family protein [Flaviflexus massiliensis]